MNLIKGMIKRLKRNERGAVLTEMALAIPLYMLILSGLIESANYLLLNLKMQHTVIAISDLVTRDEDISEATMADIFEAVPEIMAPYGTGTNTNMFVSAISQSEDQPLSVYWQRHSGTLHVVSDFGAEGVSATLPAGLTLRDDETILATEIFYYYQPLIFNFLSDHLVRKVAFFRPRIGALQEIE